MKRFLYAPQGDPYKANFYEGMSLPITGRMVAVVTEDDFINPTGDKIADFVSDLLYALQNSEPLPKGVVAAQVVSIERLINLMTRQLVDA